MTNEVVVNQNGIYITYNNKIIYRKLSQIIFCRTFGRNCQIYFDDGSKEIAPICLKDLMLLLPADSFNRCHTHFLIHLFIMDKGYIFKDKIYYKEHVIPVSRLRINQLIQSIKNYFKIPVKKVD